MLCPEFTAATFNQEQSPDSFAKVDIRPETRKKFGNSFDISMFVRTRRDAGTIFRLGEEVTEAGTGNNSLFIQAEVDPNGQLAVQVKLDESKEERYTVEGSHLRINDGSPQLISIQKEKGLVRISINGSEHFRKTVNDKTSFEPNVMYIGGEVVPTPAEAPIVVSDDVTSATMLLNGTLQYEDVDALMSPQSPVFSPKIIHPFKGVIQDVRINLSSGSVIYMGQPQNIIRTAYIVEFFNLDIPPVRFQDLLDFLHITCVN